MARRRAAHASSTGELSFDASGSTSGVSRRSLARSRSLRRVAGAESTAGPPTRLARLGAAGFVAPRPLKAMREVNGTLMAAMDPCASVGVLDRYFPNAPFFSDEEAFWQALARDSAPPRYVAVCTPSHLH